MTKTTPRRQEGNHATQTIPQREDASRGADTTRVAHEPSPDRQEGDPECLVRRGETALTDTDRAAAFRARGDLRAVRQLANGSDNPAVRERATTVVDAFDRLRRAVWSSQPDERSSNYPATRRSRHE